MKDEGYQTNGEQEDIAYPDDEEGDPVQTNPYVLEHLGFDPLDLDFDDD